MNYAKYIPIDVVNGEGTRCTLFVQGCNFHCKGCYNQSTWNPKGGFPFTEELKNQIIEDLNSTRIKLHGISILGGEPLADYNYNDVLQLCKDIKFSTNKSIWLWTGYEEDELPEPKKEILKYLDVIKYGRFIESLKDRKLPLYGSSNQKIVTLSIN